MLLRPPGVPQLHLALVCRLIASKRILKLSKRCFCQRQHRQILTLYKEKMGNFFPSKVDPIIPTEGNFSLLPFPAIIRNRLLITTEVGEQALSFTCVKDSLIYLLMLCFFFLVRFLYFLFIWLGINSVSITFSLRKGEMNL